MATQPNIVEIFDEAQKGCATFRAILKARSSAETPIPWAEIIGKSFEGLSLPDITNKPLITNFYNSLFSFMDTDS